MEEIALIHNQHHFGVDHTLELACAKLGQRATRQSVRAVITGCKQCTSIDPAATFRWQKGKITHGAVWQHLAVDVTHVNGKPYLSCIDCASHFTVWWALKNESAREVAGHLLQLFAEIRLPETLLSDNETNFRSAAVQQVLTAWGVTSEFSCAYRAQGNGVVECVHHTIKRMVARSGRSVDEMTFWYNATKGERPASPYEMVFRASPRMPGVCEQ